MKKNTFIEGAFISTFSILLCKIIGLLYVIPFYSLIGNKGGALYSYAYSIYAIFLSLSTCGIPLAISKNISEYNELGYHKAKNDVYKFGKYIILGLGLFSCLILLVFAPNIAYLILGNVEGGNTIEDVSTAIRIVSLSLLIVPSLSVTRGYLNGHKMILPTSISEVIEQVVRVLVIVVGSFLTIKVFNLPTNVAVYIAVAGAGIGALVAFLYLKLKLKRNKDAIETESKDEPEYRKKDILKKIILYALPFVVIDLIRSAYGMVDSFTVVKTMVNLGYDVSVAETTIGVLATWATKLNMIVASVALGFVTSLIPNIAGSVAKNDLEDVNNKINELYKTLLFVVLPMTIGLSFLAQPVWVAFYGYDSLSIGIFRYYILQAIIFCVYTIALNLAQSMNQSKISLGSLFVSFLLKVILNAPMMRLFVMVGIDAYYAPIVTNILVQGGVTLFIMCALKHKFKFNYKDSLKTILKIVLTLVVMVLILSGLSLIIPLTVTSRLKAVMIIIPYIIVGVIAYIGMSYKIGLLSDVFGDKKISTVIKKIKSKFSKK